jgi:hypothetical protein
MVNRVTGLGLTAPATGADLDEAAAFFADAGVAEWAVALAPAAQSADLHGLLAARGFRAGYAWAKFRRGAEPPPPASTELRVERVDGEGGRDFALVVSEAYGMPAAAREWQAKVPGLAGFRCYVAYDGEEPAAAGALFVDGETGWLSFGGTRAEHRRRGGQNAIFGARIRAAAEAGVRTLVTETGELVADRPSSSYRNILRNGFEVAYVRPNLLSPA